MTSHRHDGWTLVATSDCHGMQREAGEMADTRNIETSGPIGSGYPVSEPNRPTAWVGMVVFGGVMLMLLGTFHAIMGLVAVFDPGYYLVTRNGLVVSVDYTTWGWIHLVAGALAGIAGIGVLAGQMWARVVGIVIAVLSAIVNVAFIAAYPVWSTIVIAFDVLVVYALAVHGKEVRD
jgi:hypothetical protein